MNDDIVGVIYPIQKEFIDRILDQGKKVFLKFIGRIPKKGMRLKPGHKLIFYESDSNKVLVGEAEIIELDFMKYKEALKKHKKDIFLSPSELKEYVEDRQDRKMLILTLQNAKRYSSPVPMFGPMTMTGRYVTKETYVQTFG